MKYGFSLETINLRNSGPNQLVMQSKTYWVDILKYIAAAGYKGIEMPLNPYTAEPVSFEIGRCGDPISKFAVDSQYGGAKKFVEMINDFGIEEITGLHISANDTMLDLIARFQDKELFFEELEKLADHAMRFAGELNVNTIILSPSPEMGYITKYYANIEGFKDKLDQTIQHICDKASKINIKVGIKNEFWSIYAGDKIAPLIRNIDNAYLSFDLAHLFIAKCDLKQLISNCNKKILAPRFCDSDFIDEEENCKKTNAELPQKGRQRLFCDMGDGKVNFIEAINILKDAGYNGYIICECKKTFNVYKALLKMKWYIDHVLSK